MADQSLNEQQLTGPGVSDSPLTRIFEARWVLAVSILGAAGASAFFDVPFIVTGAFLVLTLLATAFAPRRSDKPKVKFKVQREMRRMWPGTGMKVTVDALETPCFVADGKGITRYVNKKALSLYDGVKPGDPLSFSLRAPSLLETFERVCIKGQAERISWIEKVPTEKWFEAHIAPINMPGKAGADRKSIAPDFILVVIHDLTENRRLERTRTDFVANASHELRTPLASLTGFIETLQGPARNDPDAQSRFLGIMLDQARRMRRLIDDILSLSRIELKAHVKPITVVNFKEIVQHTADALSPLAADLEVEIRLDMPSESVMVNGDRDELIQVAENLVENALKYGYSGQFVDVKLFKQSDSLEQTAWQLSVRDYGEGIPSEHLPRLTERFYRVDVESSRAMKGTGLGLAIVKHILARHGGRLEVESNFGEGAEFKFSLAEVDNNTQVSSNATA